MSTREDLIQAKLVELRIAEEDKKRKQFEAEIAAEALLRVETEKLNIAIEYGDWKAIDELAGVRQCHSQFYDDRTGSACESIRTKARMVLAEQSILALQKRQEQEKQKQDLERTSRQAFDRAQKEAELAALPIETIIVAIPQLKEYCQKYGGGYIINSGLQWQGKEMMKNNLIKNQNQLTEYEAELSRRKSINKEAVEERIQNAPFEAKVGCSIDVYNKLKKEVDDSVQFIIDQIAEYKVIEVKIQSWLNTVHPVYLGRIRDIIDRKDIQDEYDTMFGNELNIIGKKIVACYQDTMSKMYIRGKPLNTIEFLPMLINTIKLNVTGITTTRWEDISRSNNKINKDNIAHFFHHLQIKYMRETTDYNGICGQPSRVPPTIPDIPWQ